MKTSTLEQSREMAEKAVRALEDRKAEEIRVLDIHEISTLADYFIIASGTNHSQTQAMADIVEETLGRAGFELKDQEGYENAAWILQDFGDVIVHIFDQEQRSFYDLERIWRDASVVEL